MGFQKSFKKNDKAVSPVIGVILMVAITVILAAAIGSSVFGQGTTQSAPQANLDIKAVSPYDSTKSTVGGVVKIEHLGGDPINLATSSTKIMASINGGTSQKIIPGSLTTIGVGDVKNLDLNTATNTPISYKVGDVTTYIVSGDIVNIKFIDSTTNQIICDKDVRFT